MPVIKNVHLISVQSWTYLKLLAQLPHGVSISKISRLFDLASEFLNLKISSLIFKFLAWISFV